MSTWLDIFTIQDGLITECHRITTTDRSRPLSDPITRTPASITQHLIVYHGQTCRKSNVCSLGLLSNRLWIVQVSLETVGGKSALNDLPSISLRSTGTSTHSEFAAYLSPGFAADNSFHLLYTATLGNTIIPSIERYTSPAPSSPHLCRAVFYSASSLFLSAS